MRCKRCTHIGTSRKPLRKSVTGGAFGDDNAQ